MSDRASKGEYEDKSGPEIKRFLLEKSNLAKEFEFQEKVVPDEEEDIKKILLYWSDEKKLNLILTTGKTFRNINLFLFFLFTFFFLKEGLDFLREMSHQKPQRRFWKEKRSG